MVPAVPGRQNCFWWLQRRLTSGRGDATPCKRGEERCGKEPSTAKKTAKPLDDGGRARTIVEFRGSDLNCSGR